MIFLIFGTTRKKELVHAVFAGGEKIVNVASDSGIAMILDVVTHIR